MNDSAIKVENLSNKYFVGSGKNVIIGNGSVMFGDRKENAIVLGNPTQLSKNIEL